MITSRDLHCEEPEERNFTSARKAGYYDAPLEPPRQIVKVSHKSNTVFGSVSTTHSFEAVNEEGVVIRAESFRLPTTTLQTALSSRLHVFKQALIQDGYQIEAE